MQYINPVNWFLWTGQFVSAYFVSIPWKEAPKSIPAIILVLVLIGVWAVASTDQSNSWRNQLINSQLAEAAQQDDFETMELVLKRQLASRPNDSDLNYRLATTLKEKGDDEEAAEIMKSLAFGKNHVDSAKWVVANEFVGKAWSDLDSDQRDQFGALLKLITTEEPKVVGFKRLYADYLIASEKFREATGVLEELSLTEPMRGLQAAALYRRLGNENRADVLGEATLKHVSKLLDDDPTNTILSLAVAQTQLFADRFEDAIRTIQRAIKRAKTPELADRARSAMGEAIVAWIMYLERNTDDSPSAQIDLMRKLSVAVRYAPDNPRVLTLVTDKVLSSAQSNHPEVKKLQKTLVEGSSPGISHFIIGTAALMQDKTDVALKHLKIAAELLPQSAAILNNLAVAMTTRKDARLEDALNLVEQAIEQTKPQTTPHFFETRGQILFRMERYQEAIPDLLRALTVDSLKLNAHKSLAVCYEKVGMEEMVAGHREAIEKLEKEAEQKIGTPDDEL